MAAGPVQPKGGPPAADVLDEEPDVVRAFAEVAEAITKDVQLDELLHLVARKVCDLLAIRRCSVYLQHGRSGLYRGRVGETGADDDEAIKRLTAGGAADYFTQEIVRTGRPVLIRDARSDPRTHRSIMPAWGMRTVLGVPMSVHDDVIGILYLDNADDPYTFTDRDQRVAGTFANLAALAITQAQGAAELRESLRTIARQNTSLRKAAAMEERFTTSALDGGGVAGIIGSVARTTGKPCALYDDAGRRLAVARPDGASAPVPKLLETPFRQLPTVIEALESLQPQRPLVVGPMPGVGLTHRYLVTPVTARDELWGYLVLMEYGARLSAIDTLAVRRAGTIVALEMSMTRRSAAARADAHAAFVRDLVGAGDPAVLRRSAAATGVDLDRGFRIAAVGRDRAWSHGEVEAVVHDAALAQPVVVGVVDGQVVLVLETGESSGVAGADRVSAAVERVGRALDPDGVARIGLSGICSGYEDGAAGLAEARLALECLDRSQALADRRVLRADELGVGRLLLSVAGEATAARFARQTLGPVLDAGPKRAAAMLESLEAFLLANLSVREAAATLEVHENTIRYRLSRVTDLTGLDVLANVEHQLTAQVALMVLRFASASTDTAGPMRTTTRSRGRASPRPQAPDPDALVAAD